MGTRLVQLSDLHLGRSFGSLGGPETLREELAAASVDAVRQACDLVRERDAAALLVAGDLFDRPEIDEELTPRVQALLGELGRPVLVSPGNHDAYGPLSVWNNAALERLGLAAWPANVHIFATRRLVPHVLLDGELAVHGHRVEGYHSEGDSPLMDVALVPEARWNVLLFHGALTDGRFVDRTTVPFTMAQLAEIGADYAAVGHYHRHIPIAHEGRLLGAYAGTPVPGEWNEDPHGGVLVVELGDEGPQIELCEVFAGQIARLAVEADGPFESGDDALGRIRQALGAVGFDADDIACVTLRGLSRVQLDVDALAEQLQGELRHVLVRDETQPEVALEPEAGERITVESQFVAQMSTQIEQCDDPQRRAVLEAARRYGLLALRGRVVRPPAVVMDGVAPGGRDAD